MRFRAPRVASAFSSARLRSEEHTSELQSLRHLVCRLLLEKKGTAGRTKARTGLGHDIGPGGLGGAARRHGRAVCRVSPGMMTAPTDPLDPAPFFLMDPGPPEFDPLPLRPALRT